jgi:hypothetical protein
MGETREREREKEREGFLLSIPQNLFWTGRLGPNINNNCFLMA